ncbi:helix-turn-helix domain-containing protein [Kitasatospora cineracea]|uniref:Helix-turn-helix protein n=1 Tax=Kitasatospora cineracea TaxID=88074 RepID=A0A3N4R7H7_9ACTN|nr:helix-turn-helix domain-containing protein [Kitasatospora cineracea]RPE27319.1 helix-turn-helix protein [Kitasatospora cineracea]
MEANDSMEPMDQEADVGLTATFGKFYKVADLAVLMKVSPTTLYTAIEKGDLEAISIGGSRGALRVRHANFTDYLERHKTRALVAP